MTTTEILINVIPSETRVALIENGIVQEVHVERNTNKGLVGNIYIGKVSRVLPGMQAAFVDIGLEKAAFLHASDILHVAEVQDDLKSQEMKVKDIRELVREGQELQVQVVKDPIGTKGARLTTDITIPSRHLVYIPSSETCGISQRIEDEQERQRLLTMLTELNAGLGGGLIARTAAEGATREELEQDVQFLTRLWSKVQSRKARKKNRLIYEDLPLARRILRDFAGEAIDRIRVDSNLSYNEIKGFVEDFIPELVPRLEYYQGELPIFDLFDVENEIQRALQRRVDLKSGGYIIIDQTEAMTTVDINTGAFVGHRNLEDTIFNTNIEATQAIARQLRLRNLGGMVLIDFIDMQSEEHRHRVLSSLTAAMQKDRVKSQIHGFTALGLVELTRKRTRESLEHTLMSECKACQARGTLKTVETICCEVMREIVRVNRAYQAEYFLVYASPVVAELLLTEESHMLAEVEAFIEKQIKVQSEPLYHQDKFDVVMM